MVTLLDHIENLSKYSEDSPDVILQSILYNDLIIDEDTLLSYFVQITPWETNIMTLWMDGDSNKIRQWLKEICKKNNCNTIFGITKRWKAIKRKYNAKPLGVLMEWEVF